MPLREHLLAVVEPNEAGEASLDHATDLVARGGKATVVLLVNEQVRDDVRQFSESEDLDPYTGHAMALDRLVEHYTSRVGGADTEAIVVDSANSARDLLDVAARSHVSSIAIPQQIVSRRPLRKLVSHAHVPVLVTPAA